MISAFSPYPGKKKKKSKTSLATYFCCICDVASVERVLLVLLGSFYVKIFSKRICLRLFLSQTGKRLIVSFFLLNRYPSRSRSPSSPGRRESWSSPALPIASSAGGHQPCSPPPWGPHPPAPTITSLSSLWSTPADVSHPLCLPPSHFALWALSGRPHGVPVLSSVPQTGPSASCPLILAVLCELPWSRTWPSAGQLPHRHSFFSDL